MKTFELGPLYFQASLPVIVMAGIALITTAVLCLMAIRRSVRPWRTGPLEMLRFLCVLLVITMLFGPEWRKSKSTNKEPEIAIIWDESHSMTTEDARLPASLAGENDPKVTTRDDLAGRILATEFWRDFEKDGAHRVTQTSFGIPPGPEASESEKALAGTDLDGALRRVIESSTNLRSVILLTDGDWNTGKPPVGAAQQLRLRGAPLYSLPIGSANRLPDLDLESVNAPTYGIVGENVQIPFTIQSSLTRDVRTIVRIKGESGVERTKDITIPANDIYYDSILWRIEKEGNSKLTLSIPVANDELVARNNQREFVMNGKPENIRVLVIETLPRWEYRFIRNALSRDPGVKVDCLLFHPDLGMGDGPDYIQEFPEKLEDFQKYDVVLIGDIGIGKHQLTVKQANLIKGLVENQASGVIFMPGPQGKQTTLSKSDLADLLPVVLDEKNPQGYSSTTAAPIRLTTEGEKSLLTMLGDDESQNEGIWASLPGFYWQAPVQKAKSGTRVLAVNDNRSNESGRLPVLVTARAGSGKVLYMATDSAWRWRRGVEDLYHYRFWGQVARWMSYQRNMAAGERLRLFFSPERPKPGDPVFLSANAFADTGAPLREGKVLVDLATPDGSNQRLELKRQEGEWGAFTGRFKITQPGTWLLKAYVEGEPDTTVEAKIISQRDEIEKSGLPARPDVLEEMAKIARGGIVSADELPELVREIRSLPQPKPLVSATKLWAHWLAPVILITLLSLFWIGRKFNGTF